MVHLLLFLLIIYIFTQSKNDSQYFNYFLMKFQVKAGRFNFDQDTKKVTALKDKGLIKIFQNEEQETHFVWTDIQKKTEQIDVIVFPGDAVFEEISDRKNTFVLRFESYEDRYFFWLQEKIDPQEVVKSINAVMNYMGEDQMIDQAEKPAEKVEKPQVKQEQGGIAHFIKNMQQGMKQWQQKQKQEQKNAITHLYEAIGGEALNQIVSELDEEDKTELLEHMPDGRKDIKHVASNIRSPQFLQALDVLSDALNSENALPLFMELGLDKKFLHDYYGVEAFLRALNEWGKEKKEEPPK